MRCQLKVNLPFLSEEMKTIIDATEGFFVDSGGCRKFFPYGWE